MIPICQGRRVLITATGEHIVQDFTGYYLSIEELCRLCRDFAADCHDGFVGNDKAYLEIKLKEMP